MDLASGHERSTRVWRVSRDGWLQQLRAAGTDASAVETLLTDGAPDDGLQHAGQAILRCPPTAGLIACAGPLLEPLTRRGWTGDPELIAELDHARAGTTSKLSALPVDLDDLGEALHQSPACVSYIDLDNGTVWPGELFDIGQEPEDFDADDSHRWLAVVGGGSKAAYAVMERFMSTIDGPGLALRLQDEISGSGAFRRFNTELSRHGDEYTSWHRFRDDARLGHARAWLADHGRRSTR